MSTGVLWYNSNYFIRFHTLEKEREREMSNTATSKAGLDSVWRKGDPPSVTMGGLRSAGYVVERDVYGCAGEVIKIWHNQKLVGAFKVHREIGRCWADVDLYQPISVEGDSYTRIRVVVSEGCQ